MGLTAASNRTGKYDGETAMETICIGVVGMRCQACVKSVSTALKNLPGVSQVEVSLEAARPESPTTRRWQASPSSPRRSMRRALQTAELLPFR
jgi:copper chaperone CopZ